MQSKSFKDLIVYKKAFNLAMRIFQVCRNFPKEETYSLTDQVLKSTRSVCANIAEGYRKRQYPAHFVSKISDADIENSETQVWIDSATACGYVSEELKIELCQESEEIGKLLNHMIHNPEKYLPNKDK